MHVSTRLCGYYFVVTRRLLLLVCVAVATSESAAQAPPPFEVHEATIAQIHAAMRAGRLTCRALVEQYLAAHRRLRQERPGAQRHRRHQPRGARRGRRARSPLRAGRPDRPAALHPDDREGQLRDDRPAERQRLARARRASSRPRTRSRCSAVKDAGAIVLAKSNMAEWAFTPVRDAELDPAGLHEESVRARSRHGRIERRHRGGGRRQLRRRRPRQRHRQLDSRAVVAPGAGRHPLDDGADEPRRA